MNEIDLTPSPDAIERLQKVLSELPPVRIATAHQFADGMYARTILIPKNLILVGAVHKREHFFIVIRGDIILVTAEGGVRITKPTVLVSKPGTKRAGWAQEDTIVMTVHRTDLHDIAQIESEIAEYDPRSMYLPGNVPKPNGVLT